MISSQLELRSPKRATTMTEPTEHWDRVYSTKATDAVSWFAPHLERSLFLISQYGAGPQTAILDVGGGASTLVDDLLERGHKDVTVLDLSAEAISAARARLGDAADSASWMVADVTTVSLPPGRYDIWHDRAVFHFLTSPEQRQRYVERVLTSVRPGGFVIVATFGPDGPERCSGLPVARYDADGIHAEFGTHFVKLGSDIETHVTPWGADQQFVYCYCRVS